MVASRPLDFCIKREPIHGSFRWVRIKIALETAMIRTLEAGVLIGTLAVVNAASLGGQTPSSPSAPVFSIGQPPIWRQQLTAQGGTAFSEEDRTGATLSYGV